MSLSEDRINNLGDRLLDKWVELQPYHAISRMSFKYRGTFRELAKECFRYFKEAEPDNVQLNEVLQATKNFNLTPEQLSSIINSVNKSLYSYTDGHYEQD